jgi:hypothetical protein
MKKVFLFILITILAGSCADNEDSDKVNVNPNSSTLPLNGTFVNAPGESLMGMVEINNSSGAVTLVLDDTFAAAGPDLKIYLSVDAKATEYVSLGSLKMSKGMQTYAIPDGVDLGKYGKYVVIWCEKYSVLFGSAEMM